MRAGAALGGLVLLLALAAGARAGVPAVELATDLSPSVARDIDESGRIYVEGPDALDGRPAGQILLPPHPGGGELLLPCFRAPQCFHEVRRSGWLRRIGAHHRAEGVVRIGRPLYPRPGDLVGGWHRDDPSRRPRRARGRRPRGTRKLRRRLRGIRVEGPGLVRHGPRLLERTRRGADRAREPRLLQHRKGPYPERISDAGEIVGSTEGSGLRAAIWKPPGYALEFLGELAGGATSRAHDLDSSGLVVGSSDDGSGDVAVVWTPNGSGYDAIPLPVPAGFAGGSCTQATAISDSGRQVREIF